MKPVIALVGRPNVGKSTLFNRLTRRRDAIVADVPGTTRDRHYGEGRLGNHAFITIDTGGLVPGEEEGIHVETARQTAQAIAEADAVVFVVDARSGLTSADREIALRLRKLGLRVQVAANKCEGLAAEAAVADFHELGLGVPAPISAAHGNGVQALLEAVLENFPPEPETGDESGGARIARIAVVGRPNVGKSTLVNRLVGEERLVTFDQPGTTRDAIEVPFERGGKSYILVDTAGLRRRGKEGETVERTSIVKTLQAIEAANVVVLMLDAQDGVSEQDAHVAGFILECGRAVIVVINKWDAADRDARERVKAELQWKLGFLTFADTHFVSAKKGTGLTVIMKSVDAAYAAAFVKLSTPKLTRTLAAAVERQQPPRRGIIRPKMRYAHQGGMNPPRIIIHGSALDAVPDSYRRYLEGVYRKAFDIRGTPLAIEFRTAVNPYVARRAAKGRK